MSKDFKPGDKIYAFSGARKADIVHGTFVQLHDGYVLMEIPDVGFRSYPADKVHPDLYANLRDLP